MKKEGKEKTDLGWQPEVSMYEQAQAGCLESLNQLMERHEPRVRYAVKRQNLGDLPYEEVVQAGRIGLWQAMTLEEGVAYAGSLLEKNSPKEKQA